MTWVLLQVAAGGALGAVARHLTGILAAMCLGPGFPFGTMLVNAVGCLAIGIVFSAFAEDSSGAARPMPFVMSGFLGGYTTMSAFALDAWQLLQGGRTGEALLYAAGTVIVAFAALAAGISLGRWAAA